MGRVVAIGAVVVIVAVLLVWLVRWLAKQDERREDKRAGRPVNGDLSARQERELLTENDKAAIILRRIIAPPSTVDDITVLPHDLRSDVEQWVVRHDKRKASL